MRLGCIDGGGGRTEEGRKKDVDEERNKSRTERKKKIGSRLANEVRLRHLDA